jgi:hypothetical protein
MTIDLTRRALFALALAVATPVAALAQDATPTFDPSTLTVTAADGSAVDYKVNDLGVYLSHNAGYDDVPPSTDFSLSFVVLSPIDAKLLEWAADDKATRDITIVASVPGADGAATELKYEITGARITSVSTSHTTYTPPSISLSVVADTLVVDGVTLK